MFNPNRIKRKDENYHPEPDSLSLFVAGNEQNKRVCVFGRKSKTWVARVCVCVCIFSSFFFSQLIQIAQYFSLLFCYSPCFFSYAGFCILKLSFFSLILFFLHFCFRCFFINVRFIPIVLCVYYEASHLLCINAPNKWCLNHSREATSVASVLKSFVINKSYVHVLNIFSLEFCFRFSSAWFVSVREICVSYVELYE